MELASNRVETVFVLTRSFSRFSAGTKFIIKSQTGGVVSHCETLYPINDDGVERRVHADIPSNLLDLVRNRER